MNNENNRELDWTPFEQELAGRLRKVRGRPTSACISPEDLIGLVEQGARYPQAATLRAHLVDCDYCLEEFNAVRELVREAGVGDRATARDDALASLPCEGVGGWSLAAPGSLVKT